jgi:hypothetical protein
VRAEGWYRDPWGLHEGRWFSGGKATSLVRDGDGDGRDEPPVGDPPAPLEELPGAADSSDMKRADDVNRNSKPYERGFLAALDIIIGRVPFLGRNPFR